MEATEVSAEFAVSPQRLYRAWLDGSQHSAMTGGVASVEPWVGGQLTAWDGYIRGRILELGPDRRIVQTWRTTEFPEGSPDSRLEILFEPTALGTRMTLRHSQIPDGQGIMYRDGWEESYFRPMRGYFSAAAPAPVAKPAAVQVPKVAPKVPARKVKRSTKKVKKVAKKPKKRPAKKVSKKVARKARRKPAREIAKRATRRVRKKTARKATKRSRRR